MTTIALIAQLVGPWALRWSRRPGPGELGIVETEAGEILVYLPREYGEKSDPWPLLVFLHGSGERGTDLNLVRQSGLPQLLDEGLDYPCVVVAPQCRQGSSWQTEAVIPAVDCILSSFRIDPNRVYLTGYSMGGHGTWRVAVEVPGRFAAIVPLCGAGDSRRAEQLHGTPVWAFHGSRDEVVPIGVSREMVESVNREGGNARLSVLEGQEHDICREVYMRAELIEWLLAQRLE